MIDILQRHKFDIDKFDDIENIESLNAYDIILCDIQGVGTKFNTSYQGAYLVKEIYKRYLKIWFKSLIGDIIMAFQAKDFIDNALIQKYARAQVDNPSLAKEVDANKMLSSMNDIALMQKFYVNMNVKVQNISKNITDIKTHQYSRTSFVLSC